MPATDPPPAHHAALVLQSTGKPPEIEMRPTPRPTPGTAVIRVLASIVLSYTSEVVSGKRHYPYPTPFVPGISAVGRIVAIGPDAAVLKVGDLVFADGFLRGRDEPDAVALVGSHQGGSEASAKLVQTEFRDGTYAENAKAALGNLLRLPDSVSYTPPQWSLLFRLLVPFGGLINEGGLDLRPGETAVVSPATGQFGGAAVEVALAMGARVVALGRNELALQRLKKGLSDYGDRLRTVPMKDDPAVDTAAVGPVDCFFDISPPWLRKARTSNLASWH